MKMGKRVVNVKMVWILLSCFWSVSTLASSASSVPMKVKSLEHSFADLLVGQMSSKMDLDSSLFEVTVSNLLIMPPVEASDKIELLEIFALGTHGSSRIDGLISVPASIRINQQSIEEVTLSGLVKVTGPVWVAASTLNRDQVISADSMRLTTMPWSRLPSNAFLTSQSDLNGRALKRTVSRGSILYPELLRGPSAVKIGSAVVLTVQSGPGVIIRSRALAKQAGSIGEVIRVEQLETKKIVRGLITGPNKVEVQL